MILMNILPRDMALHRPILDYFKGNLLATDESVLVKSFSRFIGIRLSVCALECTSMWIMMGFQLIVSRFSQ